MQSQSQNILTFKKEWFDFQGYSPHKGQSKLHFPEKKTARFFVIICGRGYGKTYSSAKEASFYASLPNKKVALIGLSYKKSKLLFDEIWRTMVIPNKKDVAKASEKDQYVRFTWNSTIEGLSADNPDSLVGDEYDLVILDEAAKMKQEIWDMYVSPAVGRRNGKAIFISTPQGFNWLYDKFLLGKKDEEWESHTAPAWENHHAYPDGLKNKVIQERKRNMSKEVFEQEYGAQFTTFAGKVYPFDRTLDMGYFPYNPNLPTYCSIDFGYRMPSVGWFQTYKIGGITHINMIDEIMHEQNVKTDKLVEMILKKGYNTIEYYGDPAGMQVQGQSGLGDIEIFRRKGIVVKWVRDKVSRDKASGETHVRSFIESASGLRRLHLDKKCQGMAEDLESLRYPETQDLKPVSMKDGYHDHGGDMIRFFFVNRFPIKNREVKIRKR